MCETFWPKYCLGFKYIMIFSSDKQRKKQKYILSAPSQLKRRGGLLKSLPQYRYRLKIAPKKMPIYKKFIRFKGI